MTEVKNTQSQPSLFDVPAKPVIIDESKTKFHGVTYDEKKDRARFTGQLKRLAEQIQDGQWQLATDICAKADVSYSALRNRISDLRTYHAFKIESDRVKEGLWKYRFVGIMTPEEHKKYLDGLKAKRRKPIGNPVLWGKMMQSIYIHAKKPTNDSIKGDTKKKLLEDAQEWAWDMSKRIAQHSAGIKPEWMTEAEWQDVKNVVGSYDFHD